MCVCVCVCVFFFLLVDFLDIFLFPSIESRENGCEATLFLNSFFFSCPCFILLVTS